MPSPEQEQIRASEEARVETLVDLCRGFTEDTPLSISYIQERRHYLPPGVTQPDEVLFVTLNEKNGIIDVRDEPGGVTRGVQLIYVETIEKA